MESDSSDDSSYITTYSQDIRIETQLKLLREQQSAERTATERVRQLQFEAYAAAGDLELFHSVGLQVVTFNHRKIKIAFVPAQVTACVSSKLRFFCSIRFDGRHWNIRHNSLPLDLKRHVYRLFCGFKNGRTAFDVKDADVFGVVVRIYEMLVDWAREHARFRKDKYERYLRHEDGVELDTDDEEIFLDDYARADLYQRRVNIWRRMIPPKDRPGARTHTRKLRPLKLRL